MISLASTAHAANFCLAFNTSIKVVASGFTLPLKGTCSAFNGYYLNKPGFLLAGDVCRSSDGTTYLFNTFTQFSGLPDSLVGTWASSSGTGTGKECTSAACNTFSVAVIKCPINTPIPHNLFGFEAETSSPFLTREEP